MQLRQTMVRQSQMKSTRRQLRRLGNNKWLPPHYARESKMSVFRDLYSDPTAAFRGRWPSEESEMTHWRNRLGNVVPKPMTTRSLPACYPDLRV